MDEKASYRMSSSGNRSQTFRTAYFSLVFFPIFLVLPTQFEFPPFFSIMLMHVSRIGDQRYIVPIDRYRESLGRAEKR